MKAAQVSISRLVNETTIGHLHNGILLGHKKKKILPFANSMDGPGKHYTKWNKPVRERQITYDFTHMCNLMKNWTNKQNRDGLIDTEQEDS